MMLSKNEVHVHYFSSLIEENEYLKRKINFLLLHAEQLADRDMVQGMENLNFQLIELRDIKNSKSWKLTRPLRKLSRIIQKFRKNI